MMKFVILLVVGVITRQSYGDEPEAIVGGNNAVAGQFKHQVSVQRENSHHCGGALISDTHVVTAAHCIPSDPAEWGDFTVITGTTDWKRGERHQIKCIQVHPGYIRTPYYLDNDIAVITLETRVISNERQAPIRLASRDYGDDIQTRVLASGWGETRFNSGITDLLKWVELRIVPLSECVEVRGTNISKNQICAYLSVGKGVCRGDSGGPLICNGELVGVVSYGTPCGVGDPDVFTNIYTYLGFIRQCQRQC